MKTKTTIFITIILTLLVAYGGMSLYKYGLEEKQAAYEEGYTEGVFYTARTGNVVYLENETLREIGLGELCNNLIQQQGGLK